MIKYKLVDKDGYTRKGKNGETFWLDKQEKQAHGKGKDLCSGDVIHFYDHPLLAVLFNPIHASITNPRLIAIKIDKTFAHDGLKGGCKKATFVREISMPKITPEQKIIFALKISLRYYKDKDYKKWVKNWLIGKDRSIASAENAARSAALSAGNAALSAENAVKTNKYFIRTLLKIVKGEENEI